jgi:ELWxxDGT repeat protein
VKDIWPGDDGSFPGEFTVFKNQLFFEADDGTNGSELWVTDGTEGGTMLVKDIVTGSNGSEPEEFIVFGDRLYFTNDDSHPSFGEGELWSTDGTTAGTDLVADINPGVGDAYVDDFAVVDTVLFFEADDGEYGSELWKLNLPVGTFVTSRPSSPESFILHQNFPNPFNPVTTINYILQQPAEIQLIIYDLKGSEVKRYVQGRLPAGTHSVKWEGRNESGILVASGIYFYRIEAETKEKTFVNVKKMIFMK